MATTVRDKPDSNSGVTALPKAVGSRLNDIESVVRAVLFVGIISLVAIVVSVTIMVIDQFHFNNQTYRDQSDKNNLQIEELHKEIEVLQAQLNK